MKRRRKQSTPYVMRASHKPPPHRATVLDPPDKRMPPDPVRPLTPQQLRALDLEGITDPRLRAVNRTFKRWAVTHGDGEHLPLMARSEPLYLSSSERTPPLEGPECIIVEKVYKTAPHWARHFVKKWFREKYSAVQMQEELKIKRRQSVYEERDLVLAYFLGRLIEAGLLLDSRGLVGDV